MTKDDIDKAIRERLQSGGSIKLVGGAFGDADGCGGYIEDEGEWGMRFYGCSRILRGATDPRVIDSVALTKRAILSFLRSFPFLLFFPKRLTHWIAEVYRADLGTKEPKQFSRPFEEILRVGGLLVSNLKNKEDALACLKCFVMLLSDSAYRFRFQDIIGNLHKAALGNVRKEVLLLLHLGFLRERNSNGMFDKWNLAYRLASVVLLVPSARRFVRRFLEELDVERVQIDSDDWYFCLNRKEYDFSGMSYEDRLTEKNIIDAKEGFVMLNI